MKRKPSRLALLYERLGFHSHLTAHIITLMETTYSLETPEKMRAKLASRIRELRLSQGLRQKTLAERSGVSLASLRRFEGSGRISLENLLKLAFTLHRLEDFNALFQKPKANSIAELEAMETRPQRKRGRI